MAMYRNHCNRVCAPVIQPWGTYYADLTPLNLHSGDWYWDASDYSWVRWKGELLASVNDTHAPPKDRVLVKDLMDVQIWSESGPKTLDGMTLEHQSMLNSRRKIEPVKLCEPLMRIL
jgi:hypothetical protein